MYVTLIALEHSKYATPSKFIENGLIWAATESDRFEAVDGSESSYFLFEEEEKNVGKKLQVYIRKRWNW